MRRLPTLLLFLALALLPNRTFAGDATAQLSATINEFVAIMVKTPASELRATGLPVKALELIHGRFDFAELTKRSMGPHWKGLGPAEQGEFIDGVTYRLLMTYGRTVRATGEEKVVFKKETKDGATVNVASVVTGGNSDTAIDYRLHQVNGEWRVYDMIIEHVSLISNFRAQFEREISRSSLQGLLEKIRQRQS